MQNPEDKLSFSCQQSSEAYLPIVEVPCMAYLGIPACTVFPFSATIKHGVLWKAGHLPVNVAPSSRARQRASLISWARGPRQPMRMVVHLAALLLLLLQLSNASPQAPPPPPGRTSDQQIIQWFHFHPSWGSELPMWLSPGIKCQSCLCDSHQGSNVKVVYRHRCDSHQGAAVAAPHLHRPQCPPLQRQALQLPRPHFKQGNK